MEKTNNAEWAKYVLGHITGAVTSKHDLTENDYIAAVNEAIQALEFRDNIKNILANDINPEIEHDLQQTEEYFNGRADGLLKVRHLIYMAAGKV